jgi:hypothetical protein
MYAEVDGLTSIGDDQQIEELEAACRDKGKTVAWRDRSNKTKGVVRIYRTSAAVAVIQEVVQLWTYEPNCTAGYTVRRESTVRTGRWNYDDVPYFENPNLACNKRRIGHRCSDVTIAGAKVTCINLGDGFVGSIACVSRQKDLTRGLLVSSSSYIDDGSAPTGGWELTRIEPLGTIDPAVFRQ